MTNTEKIALSIKLEREKLELDKISGKSHRERVDTFNDNLENLT